MKPWRAAAMAEGRGWRAPRVVALVAAGGRGRRVGGRTPKQLLCLGGVPMLRLAVERVVAVPAVGGLIVVAPRAELDRVRRVVARLPRPVPTLVVPGGRTRQESVRRGLDAVPEHARIVVVHDAARPFVSPALVGAVVRGARRWGAATAAVPVSDTLKLARAGRVVETLDRTGVWAAQTPQAFQAPLLRRAHALALAAGVAGTDDAMLVERLGVPVRIVPGEVSNGKVTTRADLGRARRAREVTEPTAREAAGLAVRP